MLRAAEMKHVELLVLERDTRALTQALGQLGLVHLTRAEATDGGDLIKPSSLGGELARVHLLRERITILGHTLAIAEDHPHDKTPYVEPAELANILKPIERLLEDAIARRRKLDAEIETEYQVLRDLDSFRSVEVPPSQLKELDFLHFAIGTIPAAAVPRVQEELGDKAQLLPFRSPDGQQRLVALTSRVGRFALDSVLGEHGFESEDLPDIGDGAPSEVVQRTQNRLLALAKEQEAIRKETAAVAEKHGGRLAAFRQRLRVDEQLLEAQAYFGHTRATVLISGYAPSMRIDALRESLLRVTEGRIVIEVSDPPEDDADAPTLMQNPRLLRPFEMLVQGYGYPGYREIEPTPLVAISFLTMFGVMFGDVGHGAVLVVIGLLLGRLAQAEKTRLFGQLLVMAGGASIVFGWIYGSIFGVEGLLHPPVGGWFEPMAGGNINRLLVAAIVLGVAIISLGVVLNIINRVKQRDYFAMTVDKFGIVGFIFYWGVLGLGIKSVVLGGSVTTLEIVVLVLAPLTLLFFREPLHYLMSRKGGAHKPSVMSGLIEGFVDVLETVSAYIANTVSFVRVGAFALAHAAVCVAIYSTEKVVRELPVGALWSFLVVVGGNALVIGLEGLVVGIQVVRLEYYEFFGKFFKGEGKAYDPFTLT
ncbi:hypothetical protein HQ576_02185 [bacterium]|nr:hypothetical protein [bacterium]